MDIIGSKAFYRSTQIVSVLFLPLAVLAAIIIRVDDTITVEGVVESQNQVVLRSPLADRLLDEILVTPGDDVEKDAPLARFQDPTNWRVELESKRKKMLLAKEQAETSMKLREQGAEAALTARKYQTEAETLELEVKALEDNVNRLTLRAPFAGRVTELMVKPFAMVEVGTPIVSLSAMDEKIIRCHVPESRYPYLKNGLPVAIKSNMYNYFTFKIYTGEVKWHSECATNVENGKVYETIITLTGDGREILPIGSTATCEILVENQPLYRLLTGEHKK